MKKFSKISFVVKKGNTPENQAIEWLNRPEQKNIVVVDTSSTTKNNIQIVTIWYYTEE